MDTPKSSSIALEFAVNDLANMRRTCDRLRAENVELREALQNIVKCVEDSRYEPDGYAMGEYARVVLAKLTEET